MSKLIVVCGDPGTGKTTLAKELSRKLRICCLHKDSFKEAIFEYMDCDGLEDSRKTGFCSIKTLLNVAEDQIKNCIDLIIESPFNHKDNKKLFKLWAKKYKVELFTIICSIDEDTRKERWINRLSNRNIAHQDNKRLQNQQIGKSNYDYNDMPGNLIFVETNVSVDKIRNKIIAEIKK